MVRPAGFPLNDPGGSQRVGLDTPIDQQTRELTGIVVPAYSLLCPSQYVLDGAHYQCEGNPSRVLVDNVCAYRVAKLDTISRRVIRRITEMPFHFGEYPAFNIVGHRGALT